MRPMVYSLTVVLLLALLLAGCGDTPDVASVSPAPTVPPDATEVIGATDIDTIPYDYLESPGVDSENFITATDTITRIGLTLEGRVSDEGATGGVISDDGRRVVFQSRADNIVTDATNGNEQLYLYNRDTRETTLLSVDPNGNPAEIGVYPAAFSRDGQHLVFDPLYGEPFPTAFPDPALYYWRDIAAGRTAAIPLEGGLPVGFPLTAFDADWIAENGIVFVSGASNVSPDDQNTVCSSRFTDATAMNCIDAFFKNALTGENQLVSVLPDGTQGNESVNSAVISDDGRFVAFSTYASNFLSPDANEGQCYDPPSDSAINCLDIFVRDMTTGELTLVSKATDGSQGNHDHTLYDISADGRYIFFSSTSTNLVPNDTNEAADLFQYDRDTGETTRLSVTADGGEANGISFGMSLSPDLRYLYFTSTASNLVEGDTRDGCPGPLFGTPGGNCADAYLLDRQTNTYTRISLTDTGEEPDSFAYADGFSPDARFFLVYGASLLPPYYAQYGMYLVEVPLE